MQLIDVKSEKIVLGSILRNNSGIDSVLLLIGDENFSLPQHRLIFRAFKSLDESQKPITNRTLSAKLEEDGMSPDQATILISEIASEALPIECLHDYAMNVKRADNARKLFDAVESAKSKIDSGADMIDVIGGLNTVIESFEESDQSYETDLFNECGEVIERIKKRQSGDMSDQGNPTGIESLDQMIRLSNGDLTIVAARPGGGKSVLLNQLRLSAIQSLGLRTGFISLEMSSEQMIERTAANVSGVPLSQIQGRDKMMDGGFDMIKEALKYFQPNQNPVCYKPDLTIQSIRSIARRWKRQQKIDIIFIDYAQLISASKAMNSKNRVEVVAEITRGLKIMAKELQIPVITASQLNRASEETDRPSLRHLRESGSIEQDADIVVLLHEIQEKDNNKNLCIVAKNRHGRCGDAQICFQKAIQRIS